MEELQLLLERSRQPPATSAIVLPVFYDASYTDVSTAASQYQYESKTQQWAQNLLDLCDMAGLRKDEVGPQQMHTAAIHSCMPTVQLVCLGIS
jgi:hypothetical protein